jgi:indolepyruvate ferredoxin oxidoreductase
VTVSSPLPESVSLDDKYVAESGRVLLSGLQALVRLTLDQSRLDRLHGVDTAVYVSGYQGSPLGGLDREFQRANRHLAPANVVIQPGVNEELAATAVAGTQLIGELERRRHGGVVGFWYGKNPGLDRAADAIRHGNVSGTAPLGGAVALIGDDPSCKSSTIPSSSEPMCRSLLMPVLAPGSVRELLVLGLHAVALSRMSGLWVGVKVVADVADATATVDVTGLLDPYPAPAQREHRPPTLLPPTSLDAEADLLGRRLELALDYAREAELNRITFDPARARLAVVASGTAYQAVVRALDDLGFDGDALEACGLRLAELSMPWPMDPRFAARLADGVDEILVVEDKLSFVEALLKEHLYGRPKAPAIVGKQDEQGHALVPIRGTLGANDIARVLISRLPDDLLPPAARRRVQALAADAPYRALPTLSARTPYFCSGCPHNVSTKAPADRLVGVGIGCHIMVALDEAGRGHLLGMPQMGGEGAQWLGLSPFTDDEHFVQNLGDGTFHHSGSLAIRAAVAAGVNMTYKLLYNDAVAMTGGQRPEGRMDVPTLTRWLALEGVRKVVITTADPAAYRDVELDPIASVRHRDELPEVEQALAELDGVTVLIHDDRCAAEARRLRRRGKLPTPAERVFINERVCEGCGDCGEQSTCLSVQPVDTEFGRKTRIHQASCNQDLTCIKGDCPSFLVVTPKRRDRTKPPSPPTGLPRPVRRVPAGRLLLRMPGVGGTGVVTVSQILQMAAHLDGWQAAGLEQTGLAQKGGPVISDVRLDPAGVDGTLRASDQTADVLLGFDLLGAAHESTLAVVDPQRTIAVISQSQLPTAQMVVDTELSFPPVAAARRRIDAATRSDQNLYLDAQDLSERLFGDHLPANMLLLGASFQHGCVPLSAESIERAIELNGAAVETNLAAFRWGRATAIGQLPPQMSPAQPAPADLGRAARRIIDQTGMSGELRRLLEIRVPDLIAYQNATYAQDYATRVADVAERAAARAGDEAALIAEEHARGLYKLMAYKDEYEVARLHLDAVERARLESEFGPDASVQLLLHPPVLRAIGLKRKLRLGAWVLPLLRALRAARRLRGTAFDPFGRAHVRRLERQLIAEYGELIDAALESVTPDTATTAARLAALPDVVRGYEEIKLRNVERFRTQATELLAELRRESAANGKPRLDDRPPT